MARPTSTQTRATSTPTRVRQGQADPVLHPGRPADPGISRTSPATAPPAGTNPGQPTAVGATREDAEPGHGVDGAPLAGGDQSSGTQRVEATADPATSGHSTPELDVDVISGDDPEQVEQRYAESRQRRLRRLLRQCERVTLQDFNVLALSGWPDNFSLSMARRRRDVWLLSAMLAALVFLSGITGFVPAWIAGGGFGAFVVILLIGVPFVRRLYSPKPSHLELIMYRHQLMQDARRHVAHLEGSVGLIWQCNELAEFNPSLAAPRFSALKHLSEQRRLANSLSRREHVRLYLIFILEAEKAYARLQEAYFQGHQEAIDRGWQSVASGTLGTNRGDSDTEGEAGNEASTNVGGNNAGDTDSGDNEGSTNDRGKGTGGGS